MTRAVPCLNEGETPTGCAGKSDCLVKRQEMQIFYAKQGKTVDGQSSSSMTNFGVAASWQGKGSSNAGDQKAEAAFAQYQMYPWRGLEVAAGDQHLWDTVEMMGCPL